MRRCLLLGGTEDARTLADRMVDEFGTNIELIYSLAGVTKHPVLPRQASSMEIRRQGFGGVYGLMSFLQDRNIALTVNAAHPFAARISANARQACAQIGVPYIRYRRPGWQQDPEASPPLCWQEVETFAQIEKHLIDWDSRRILLGLGAQGSQKFFDALPSDSELHRQHYIVRTIDSSILPPDDVKAHCDFVAVTPPLDESQEREFLQTYNIDTIVLRNAGADSGLAKLRAAAKLDINIVMLSAPDDPQAVTQISVCIEQTAKILSSC